MAHRLGKDFTHLTTKVVSHNKQVCGLYKRVLRNIENWEMQRDWLRFECVMMRKRFDDNKDIKDLRIAKGLLAEGEAELFKHMHPVPKQFADSPGGITYQRYPKFPDWLADYWDPIEKAQYPSYFRKREMWKKQRIDMWESKYGKIKDPWADV